jgi:hypothetical protein
MQILVTSIIAIGSSAARTEALGEYRVTLDADGGEHVLRYTVALSPEKQSVAWTPANSILSAPGIDVLVGAGVTDIVVAFHPGQTIVLPRAVSARPVGPETAVVRL